MEEELLTRVLAYLKEEKDFVVAAKKIWQQIVTFPEWKNLSFPQFLEIVKKSTKIDVIGDLKEDPFKDAGLSKEETKTEIQKMEKMGYYFGPSLVLKSHVPTPEELAGFLQSRVDQAYNSLLKVWENRPKNDPESEDQLIEILAEVQKLRREIRENLGNSKTSQKE
ncbi:hypothetical protein BMS3Abin05_02253 [bacterium BMS3Abin05]|nr:hypothetical protein BMS3Abin05_02253 [bacterium BMS3Abin05]GBE27484.1 hypothetical protein BMS3Bbin03_01409 [bacterium BMS3Bbin03]HDZ12866.1 hypothetical protein [Bacteroidota bacterium]